MQAAASGVKRSTPGPEVGCKRENMKRMLQTPVSVTYSVYVLLVGASKGGKGDTGTLSQHPQRRGWKPKHHSTSAVDNLVAACRGNNLHLHAPGRGTAVLPTLWAAAATRPRNCYWLLSPHA